MLRQYGAHKQKSFVISDICNPFSNSNLLYYEKFGSNKTNLGYCSPGCTDNFYNELQFFDGQTQRPRERLFFSNYTHLANKLYPSPINLRTIYRPMMGLRTIAGDSRKQATNFTQCPNIWSTFKLEAAVYPIDDNFNMCQDDAFYRQSKDQSIDCAYTERVGYFFITLGAATIVCMDIAWFTTLFFKKNPNFRRDFGSDCFKIQKFYVSGGFCSRFWGSFRNTLLVLKLTLTPFPIPSLNASQTLVKTLMILILSPIAKAVDIILDGIYVVRLARFLNRFWLEAKIIKLMLSLYMITVVKDMFLNLILLNTFFKKSLKLTPQKSFEFNFIVKMIGFFTEDTAQAVLQYFYFEKYQMDGDIVIIIKFLIGLLMTGKSLVTLAFAVSTVKAKSLKKKDCFIISIYLMLTLIPVLRLIGLMIQARKKGSMIRAGCLEYMIKFTDNPSIRQIDPYDIDYHHNYQWDTFYLMGRDQQKFYNENNATLKRLYVTPFNSSCLLPIDYLYFICNAICLLTILFYLFVTCFEKCFRLGKSTNIFDKKLDKSDNLSLWETNNYSKIRSKQIGDSLCLKFQDSQITTRHNFGKNTLCLRHYKQKVKYESVESLHIGKGSVVIKQLIDKKKTEKEKKQSKLRLKTKLRKKTESDLKTNKQTKGFDKIWLYKERQKLVFVYLIFMLIFALTLGLSYKPKPNYNSNSDQLEGLTSLSSIAKESKTQALYQNEYKSIDSILLLTDGSSEVSIGNQTSFLVSVYVPSGTSGVSSVTLNPRMMQTSKSCSLTHRDVIYLYGGASNPRTVFELSCKKSEIQESKLFFNFIDGSCATNNHQIVLCFSGKSRECYKTTYPRPQSWWEWFTRVKKTSYMHRSTSISLLSDKLFVTGDFEHAKSELLSLSDLIWKETTPYPDSVSVHSATSVAFQRQFYVFGGIMKSKSPNINKLNSKIMMFNPLSQAWQHVGDLKSARHGHSSLILENKVYLIGGNGFQTSEVCNISSIVRCIYIDLNENPIRLENILRPKLYPVRKTSCKPILLPEISKKVEYISNELFVLTKVNATTVITGLNLMTDRTTLKSFKTKIFSTEKSCAVKFQNEVYIYGSIQNPRQILKLDCQNKEFISVGNLRMDFNDGTCATNTKLLILCFADQNNQLCYQSKNPVPKQWWQKFTKLQKSHFRHELASISASKGSVI